MAGGASKTNAPKARKRVEAETSSLKRSKDGSAFARCDECNKDVPVGLIDMHDCSVDAKIKMHLDSQVVHTTEVKKPVVKRKSKVAEPTSKRSKKEKKERDPNMPKRPQTAFFLFMDDFRSTYKEANPDAKGGKHVAKEGGEKWKSMSDEEKKPYNDRVAELKSEYEKAMEIYKAESRDAEESSPDKEVQEVSDDEKEVPEGSDDEKEVLEVSDAE